MENASASRLLFDPKKGLWILMATAAVLLLLFPGAASLWTHEGRWAVICREMMRSGDYFHPYLFDEEYFDKPLLSYWLMIGCARIFGVLNETTMRLPGIAAGLLAIFSTVRIGTRRFGAAAGLTAGWLLATSFFFLYWSRQACSDMLNLAAIIAATAWYTERRDRPGFVTSAVTFLILAVGALMKGLIAPALAVLAILPDLVEGGRRRSCTSRRSWRRVRRPERPTRRTGSCRSFGRMSFASSSPSTTRRPATSIWNTSPSTRSPGRRSFRSSCGGRPGAGGTSVQSPAGSCWRRWPSSSSSPSAAAVGTITSSRSCPS